VNLYEFELITRYNL